MAESELTEMAGVAEAETEAAYAWALDDGDDLPTQRLTSRRITALAMASSLTVIALAGGVALTVVRQPEPVSASAPVVAPAAVLDGTYRFDFNPANNTVQGSPNPPSDSHPDQNPKTVWYAFRSACTPAGCTATETALDDTNHNIAATPNTTYQWRFTDGRWQMLPERSRETRQGCKVVQGKAVDGDQTALYTISLEPQPGGSSRGLSSATTISSECGQEGSVQQFPFVATRVGDVPLGVPVADPSTVSAPNALAAPVAGPVLDGTYRLDEDDRQVNTAFRWLGLLHG
jgi:serine/threonine protein kinase, bacterial